MMNCNMERNGVGLFREDAGSLYGLGSINGPVVRSWACIRKKLKCSWQT